MIACSFWNVLAYESGDVADPFEPVVEPLLFDPATLRRERPALELVAMTVTLEITVYSKFGFLCCCFLFLFWNSVGTLARMEGRPGSDDEEDVLGSEPEARSEMDGIDVVLRMG